MVRQAERAAASQRLIVDAARQLFARHGFHDVTIEQIAEFAGLAKGSVYYHFDSKLALFEHVVDTLQGQLAATLAAKADRSAAPTSHSIAAGIKAYLIAANRAPFRRILLIDGPSVLGWQRWREIDDGHFADTVQHGLRFVMASDTTAEELRSATSLLMGAIMQAALASGASTRPTRTATIHAATIARVLNGLAGQPPGVSP